MMRYQAHTEGREGTVFDHLPPIGDRYEDKLAADGVS
jgi:hypothetical protein